jgi:hypothetical protein
MKVTQSSTTRRSAILAGAGSLLALGSDGAKKRVAAVVTEYRPRSHADVICSRIFDGYTPNGVRVEPRTRIVSMYTDQFAPKDMSRNMTARRGFPIYPTVAERIPELELPLGARIEHVVAIGYGDLEAYGFHTLEAMQRMTPRRWRDGCGSADAQWR